MTTPPPPGHPDRPLSPAPRGIPAEFSALSPMGRMRKALRAGRRIAGMVQGTMGLEGQALPRAQVRAMVRRTARELLDAR